MRKVVSTIRSISFIIKLNKIWWI